MIRPPTPSQLYSSKARFKLNNHSGCRITSSSVNATTLPLAAEIPAFRAADLPCRASKIYRTEKRAVFAKSRIASGVLSLELLSTTTSSQSRPDGRVRREKLSRVVLRDAPRL